MPTKAELFESRYAQLVEQGITGWYEKPDISDILSLIPRPIPPRRRALELGCGAGENCLALARLGYRVMGLDISGTAAALARRLLGDEGLPASFEVHDLSKPLQPPLAIRLEKRFDLTLDGDCLHFIAGPGRLNYWQTAIRSLAPGGRFLLRTLCGEPPLEDWSALNYVPEMRASVVQGLEMNVFLEPEEILDEMKQAGLTVERAEIQPAIPGERGSRLLASAILTSEGHTPPDLREEDRTK